MRGRWEKHVPRCFQDSEKITGTSKVQKVRGAGHGAKDKDPCQRYKNQGRKKNKMKLAHHFIRSDKTVGKDGRGGNSHAVV